MESENYVYKKEVDWSTLMEGFTLPLDNQVIFLRNMENFLQRGESKIIHFFMNGKTYDAKIVNMNNSVEKRKKDAYQIRYTRNGDLSQALQQYFFKTMHHEFAHILHQTKNYSTDFNLISTDYQGPSWLNLESDEIANTMGFITRYASFSPDEDFVEIISNYITHDADYWENVLNNGGALGKIKLQKKFDIVRKYLKDSWGIDIDKLRDIVQRRSGSLSEVDLENL